MDFLPQECNTSDKLKPYYHRKDELNVYQGCLTWGNRVIIPGILREKVMTELHSGHIGIVRIGKKVQIILPIDFYVKFTD